jgi:hypothetical protein
LLAPIARLEGDSAECLVSESTAIGGPASAAPDIERATTIPNKCPGNTFLGIALSC